MSIHAQVFGRRTIFEPQVNILPIHKLAMLQKINRTAHAGSLLKEKSQKRRACMLTQNDFILLNN